MKDFREKLNDRVPIRCFGEYLATSVYFNRIYVPPYSLSIQASEHHYSSPRETLDKYEYTAMEIAILNNDDGNFVNVAEDTFFNEWDGLEEFLERFDGQVEAYVPIDLIQSLYEFIISSTHSKIDKIKEKKSKSFNEMYLDTLD